MFGSHEIFPTYRCKLQTYLFIKLANEILAYVKVFISRLSVVEQCESARLHRLVGVFIYTMYHQHLSVLENRSSKAIIIIQC